ncbi:hypothetical protein [Pseudomonas sp. LRF_L74]|uniref:hypothetical protein n=1 Tax=Pseudomonas sp. LRF_L74 TaxID=3369422 RepID=UPI003F5ECFC3
MKIYDTFLFDGELSLLHHRLAETYDLVDYFVIVEARRTYRNAPKALCFAEHRERFAWAADKIRTVALSSLGGSEATPRRRAAIQRNALVLGLRDAEPDDVVLICDADEIPSHTLLEQLRHHGLDGPARLAMTRHYEYLDLLGPRSPCCPTAEEPFPFATPALRPPCWQDLDATWHGRSAVAVRYRDLCGMDCEGHHAFHWRFVAPALPVLEQAGRHFTSTDPAARLEAKLGRVFHAEYADERGLSIPHLRRCRRHGVHHRGWWYAQRPVGDLPADLQRLAERFPEMRLPGALPAMLSRRVMRSWAWIRLWPRLPSKLVRIVDRHYERVLPLLAVPLLMADLLRGLFAAWARRRMHVHVTVGNDHILR